MHFTFPLASSLSLCSNTYMTNTKDIRTVTVAEILAIIRKVTGKPVYHVEYVRFPGGEEYLQLTTMRLL